MSSPSIISTLSYISHQIVIYLGVPILVAGVVGGLLNVIVFLSLQTFRHNACAFYLTVMSFVNVGQLISGLLTRIMISGFNVDWTQSSLFYCKYRTFQLHVCSVISLACMCLTAIDQFLATSSNPRWQQWSNVKLALRLTGGFTIFGLLHGIAYIVNYNQIVSPTTGIITCKITSASFQQYVSYFVSPILTGVLPMILTILFASMAYRNVKGLAYRTVPLVRRELDKQLSAMVFVQVVYNVFALIPNIIVNLLVANINNIENPITVASIQFASVITLTFYYLYFASGFYIYICVSERFRQQLVHVIVNIHCKCWRQPILPVNEVSP